MEKYSFKRAVTIKKKRKSDEASCSTTITQDTTGYRNNLHEDTIYVPTDSFPAMQNDSLADNMQSEDKIEYDNLDGEFLTYRGQSSEFEAYQEQNSNIDGIREDPYDHIYHNLPSNCHFLEQVPNCRYCSAKRFQHETPTFCCMSGKIKIVTPSVPGELHQLYTSQEPNAKYFRDNIQYFNSHFSFASLGVVLDKRFCNNRCGVYTFRAQGQIYHRIDQLVPKEEGPKHIYSYTSMTRMQICSKGFCHSPNLDKDLSESYRIFSHVILMSKYLEALVLFRTLMNTRLSLTQILL